MHVLVVAWSFPPAASSGTYRPLAIVDDLVARGIEVTVITADEDLWTLTGNVDHALTDRIPASVDVIRVPFPPGRLDPVINRWPAQRATDSATWAASQRADDPEFPEPGFGHWREPIELAAIDLHRRHRVDLCIATGNPYVDYAAAWALSGSFGVPYVLDDRDAWLFNVVTGQNRDNTGRRRELAEVAYRECVEAWFVNPPIAEFHRATFPESKDRIQVVENGWDPRFINPADIGPANSSADTSPVFAYVGTINEGLPLAGLINAWRLAKKRGLPPTSEFRLYGPVGYYRDVSHYERLLAGARRHGVLAMGRWPKAQLTTVYEESDVLVLAREGGEYVTSSKVYEYLATGRPIVSAVASAHDAHRLLASYPRAFAAPIESLTGLANAFVDAWRNSVTTTEQGWSAAVAIGAEFERDRLLGQALDRVVLKVAP